MKNSLFAVSFVLLASPSFAQQPPAARGAAPAAAPQAALPAGAKFAYVNVAVIVQNSAEGKADSAKVDALVKKKQGEAAALKTPTPQDQQRFQQQAQQEVAKLQQDLQVDFQKKLLPILQQLAQEKKLSMLFSAQDAGIVWAEPGLDLTAEAIKRFDAVAAKK